MDQTGEFIDLFRRLEAALRENALTGSGPREFNGMINALARQDPFIQDRWNEIDLCRQIRNILSHFPTVEGRRPLVPDQALLDVLAETIDQLEHPVRAIDAARAREHLYTVGMESPAQPTLWQMRKRGFSHVPVMEGSRLAAVFSVGTVFSAACRGAVPPMEQACIGDFMPDIELERHENERYVFVAADEPLAQVKELFQRPKQSRRKVAAVFVTAGGDAAEPLEGMITPWDVLQAMDD